MNTFKTLLGSTVAPLVGVVFGLVAMVAFGYATRWGEALGKLGSLWFWVGLLIFLGLGVVVVVLWVVPRYREKRFITALQTEDSKTPEQEAEESRRQLRNKLLAAIQTLESSPDLKKKTGLPLYALPWYLLLGASQSGKTTLLQAVANSFSPFVRPSAGASGPTQDCDWWFFNTAIILDTSGRYAFPAQVERDSGQWYRLLQLLRHYRERQPINGMIITVAAAGLVANGEEALRVEAVELRKRIDEAIRELGVNFPVYLLITQCDALEGFTDFFGCFSEQTQRQALGFLNEQRPQEGDSQPQVASVAAFEAMFTSMVERLQQLRLSLLQEKPPTGTLRQRVFCFPEEFHALQQPLRTFVEVLFGENPYQYVPFFRGLFFCSAQQQGAPVSFLRHELHFEDQRRPLPGGSKNYFLHDLFAVIWARDQGLVRRTRTASRATRRRGLLGFAGCVVLCLVIAWLVLRGYRGDRGLYAATDSRPCELAAEPAAAELRLDEVLACWREVQHLMEHNHQRAAWGKLLFNRSGLLAETLRRQYVEKFGREVLMPLDAAVTQRLSAGSDTPPLAMLLLDRLDLLRQCLTAAGCPEVLGKDGQPDYQLMLASALPRLPPEEQVAQLQHTYEAYLRWSSEPKEALRQEQTAHIDRLQSWITSKPFASHLRLWASQRYPSVTAHEYWDVPPSAEQTVQVEGAYTRVGWEEGLLPLLQRAGRAVPDTAPALEKFRKEYEAQYFAQWQRLLAAFPSGQAVWTASRARRLQLAARLLEARSPYNRIIDVTYTHLQPLLAAASTPDTPSSTTQNPTSPASGEARQSDVPTWVRVLQRYVGSESRKAYLETLEQLGKQWTGQALQARSVELAQAGFQEGIPAEKSLHPMLKAWWIIAQFQRQDGAGDPVTTAVFWPLVQGPVLFVWKVILEEASLALQESWNDLLLAVKDLPPGQKHEFLYGKEGKAVAFVKGPAAVFLQRRGEDYMRKRLLEGEVAFTDKFLLYLKQARVELPPIIVQPPKRRVNIRSTPASLEANGSLKVAKTELILDCDTGRQNLETTDSGPGTDLTFTWVVNSCAETFLRVHLADTSGQALEPLELRYQDLAQFLEQFSSAQRVLRLADFKVENPAPFSSYGIKTITLRYRFPPEQRQQVQKDVEELKRSMIDTATRLDLPARIVATSP